jgi:hypothetical protein
MSTGYQGRIKESSAEVGSVDALRADVVVVVPGELGTPVVRGNGNGLAAISVENAVPAIDDL